MLMACACFAGQVRAQETDSTSAPEAQVPTPRAGTRAAQLREMREAKRAQELQPYNSGWLERTLLSIDKAETPSILDRNFAGFYPRVGRQSRNAGGSIGVRYWNPEIGGTPLDLHGSAFVSWRRYQLYDLQFGILPHRDHQLPLRSWRGDDVYELGSVNRGGFRRFRIYGSVRYRKNPQETYFGLGPDSRLEDRTSYLLEDATYDLVIGFQAGRRVALSLHTGFRTHRIRSGEDGDVPSIEEVFDDASAPGLDNQPDYFHVTPQLFIDYRDQPGNPHRGFMLGLAYANANDLDEEAYRFDRFAADARVFIPLGSVQRVLALRALALFDDTAPGHRVPFYLQGSLGSSHTLRGYDSFRLRGEDVVLFQAEYRWEASPPIEFALFADGGTVSETGADVNYDKMRWDWGYGVRFKNYRAVLFRFDHAFGDERSRLIVRVSTAF